jgi:phage tail sheath gpL-like
MDHLMSKAGINSFPYASVQMILLDDSPFATAKATATIALTMTEPAIRTGKLTVNIGGDSYVIAVAQNDTASIILDKIEAAINNDNDAPVLADYDSVGTSLLLTMETAGTVAETLLLGAACDVAGITVTLPSRFDVSAIVRPNVSDVQAVLDVVFAAGHPILVVPYVREDLLVAVRDHCDLVSNGIEQRGCVAVYVCNDDALATAETRMQNLNAKRLVGGYLRGQSNWAGEVAAATAFVLASESDPARPLNGLPLLGIKAPPVGAWLSRAEQEDLLHNGMTPFEVGAGQKLLIVRLISGYTVNEIGVPDPSLLDITIIRSLDYVRRACRERILLRFPRSKNSASRRRAIRSELLNVLKQLEALEIVQNVEANKELLIVEEHATDRTRANARIPADVVRGLHVLAGQIDLL